MKQDSTDLLLAKLRKIVEELQQRGVDQAVINYMIK